jgi:beta-galactosidase
MKRIVAILALAFGFFSTVQIFAADAPRQRLSFDSTWKFALGDFPGAQDPAFNDSTWQPVELPHDWSIALPFDQNAPAGGAGASLPTGIGWYRKTFRLPDPDKGKIISVEFDGIRENGEVWINNHSLSKRPYSYTSVVYDITPYLNFEDKQNSGDNVIAVRADNSNQPNSRWYAGSGIYRHAWLLVTDGLHIPQWGTYVTTPQVNADGATIKIIVQVVNQSAVPAQFTLASSLLDKDGKEVAAISTSGLLNTALKNEITHQIAIAKPNLWSIDNPCLYTVRNTLRQGNKIVDQYDTPLGIRSIEFDASKGFLLNGQHVKLNGVCVHADGGSVGVAVPEGVWLRRLQILREMGCNAIRTSHNPPDPDFLDLCDRLGFCVMDESFDEWKAGKTRFGYHLYFDDWYERDVTDFVHRDRNHPSVVLWSCGNEIGEQTSVAGTAILQKLVNVFHREDPSRLVTAACDKVYAEPASARPEFMALLDVAGYNYVDRWRDRADKYYSIDRELFPQRKFIGTESGSMGGIRGNYNGLLAPTTQPAVISAPSVAIAPATLPGAPGAFGARGGRGRGGFGGFAGGGPRVNVEQLWKFVRTYDYVAGDFMWTGIDYLGEAGGQSVGSSAGVIDTCGFKKDGFYFYQSQWTSKPVLHLFPHWNWKGNEGRNISVYCYTNCDSAELFLNGKSLGVKGYEYPREGMEERYGNSPARARAPHTTSDLHLNWDVTYQPGTLKAVGTRAGQIVATDEIKTTGDPAAIDLTIDKTTATADGQDVVHAIVKIVDANGQTVPTASNNVTFEIQGEAKIIGVDNGSLSIAESYRGNQRKAFNGLCLAILQTTHNPGAIRITARSPGLREATAQLQSQTAATFTMGLPGQSAKPAVTSQAVE